MARRVAEHEWLVARNLQDSAHLVRRGEADLPAPIAAAPGPLPGLALFRGETVTIDRTGWAEARRRNRSTGLGPLERDNIGAGRIDCRKKRARAKAAPRGALKNKCRWPAHPPSVAH